MRVVICALAVLVVSVPGLYAHCQVPCGIYDDMMRIQMIVEHVRTIEKAMGQIAELSNSDDPNVNQLVRWVNEKEKHATEIQRIVGDYFLTQRIKAPGDATEEVALYHERLAQLHGMLVSAMKTKQTIDPVHCQRLLALAEAFASGYFSEADLEHLKEHNSD